LQFLFYIGAIGLRGWNGLSGQPCFKASGGILKRVKEFGPFNFIAPKHPPKNSPPVVGGCM
jgi:hypothetical protein